MEFHFGMRATSRCCAGVYGMVTNRRSWLENQSSEVNLNILPHLWDSTSQFSAKTVPQRQNPRTIESVLQCVFNFLLEENRVTTETS